MRQYKHGAINGKDSGLSPIRPQVIVWANADILAASLGTDVGNIRMKYITFQQKCILYAFSAVFCYVWLFVFCPASWAVLKVRLHRWSVLRETTDGSGRYAKSMDFAEIANADVDEGFGRGHSPV